MQNRKMIKLKAGQIELSYENGFLRQFIVNETEVLRMIYFAVRDANWGNYEPRIFNEKITVQEDYFQINYDVEYFDKSAMFFQWKVNINGLKTNEITFEIIGDTHQDFSTNRAGFCVLHPIENVAGQSLEIIHSDGEIKPYFFPKYIAAHQPFVDIMNMKWSVLGGEFEVNFEGDIFETEDQRNWGDASFKTYCTPLSLPFPRALKMGDKVRQKVSFRMNKIEKNAINKALPFKGKDLGWGAKNKPFQLGICSSKDVENLSDNCIEKLKSLNISHYRIEVYPAEKDWEKPFLNQIEQGEKLDLALEIVIIFGNNFIQEFVNLHTLIKPKLLNIKYLTVLNKDTLITNQEVIDFIPSIKPLLGNIKIGVGTNYNFTEINRERFDAKDADFIALSFDPQEHANDDLTILENAETVKYMVESITEIYQKPVHFSPIILKRRFNPYATDKAAVNVSFENQMDSRQKTDFLAKWTALLLENLAKLGAESATLFQTVGELGIMDETGNEYPVFNEIKNYGNRNQ